MVNGFNEKDLATWDDMPSLDADVGSDTWRPHSQYEDWSQVMHLLTLFQMGTAQEVLMVADFSNEGGKHGELRRAAMLSDLELGRIQYNAPCFNMLGQLLAIASEVKRIDDGDYSATPGEKKDLDPFEEVLIAATVIEGTAADSIKSRRDQLAGDGGQLLGRIRRAQASGTWTDFTRVKRIIDRGIKAEELGYALSAIPMYWQRAVETALGSAAGRWWGHTEAINGRTMDYSRTPHMVQYLPSPMGMGQRQPRRRGSQSAPDGEVL